MAAIHASLPLSHFYRETLGTEHLSQNLASNELFTPLQLDRVTVNPTRFEKYRSSLDKQPRTPWGRLREYGGMQEVQLPVEFVKPKGYPPKVVQKGHRHYGTGASDSRDLKEEQYYDVTSLKKSHVRTSDQVLDSAPSSKMNDARINLPFPAEHPYTSHIPRFSLFPKFDSPDDPVRGDPSRSKIPIHPDTPANPHPVIIVNKSKGSPYRREVQELPLESRKEPLTWQGEKDFYQLMKTVDGGKQPYYPISPKLVHPNLRLRSEDQRLELRTANALRNVERDQWKTTYDYDYTGNGSSNAMHLDDYHRKMVDDITTNEDSRNADLIPATTPKFLPPRPQEGRYARLYQQRRHLNADIRYPESNPAPDSPDVMDQREYRSLPGTPRALRRKDEWYITGRKSADPVLQSNRSANSERTARNNSVLPTTKRDDDEDNQWKTMQLTRHPEHGFDLIEKRKSLDLERQEAAAAFDVDSPTHSLKLPEVSTNYLKNYQDERNAAFKDIENFHETKKLELQYDSRHDMHALRNKVDQVGNRLEPKAFDQHAIQVHEDHDRLQRLRSNRIGSNVTKYDTGLKFSTENICDRGTITDLHDKRMEGHEEYAKPFIQDIPVTEHPEQNHRHPAPSYLAKSNPFSLSQDPLNYLPDFRSKASSELKASRTGSILKTPGSPPRTGSSKSISFNEVVKVATSEYGDRFKLSSSPLSSDMSPGRIRCSTPFPIGARKEPSVYTGISAVGPVLRPTTAYPHIDTKPQHRSDWKWNYDQRMHAEFEPLSWTPKSTLPRPQTSLLDIENRWSKSGSHKRLHESMPEQAPDMRDNTRHYEFADKSADLRFHHSIKHKETRHNFYGFNSYHFYNGNPIV